MKRMRTDHWAFSPVGGRDGGGLGAEVKGAKPGRSSSSNVNTDQQEHIRNLESEIFSLKQGHESTTTTANTLVRELTDLLNRLQPNAVTLDNRLSNQGTRQRVQEQALRYLNQEQNRESSARNSVCLMGRLGGSII